MRHRAREVEGRVTPKAILTVISGNDGSRAAFETALLIGRRFEAYVEVLHVKADANESVPVMAEGLSGSLLQELISTLEKQEKERAETVEALFDEFCVKPGSALDGSASPTPGKFGARLREVTGRAEEEVARLGRLFDVIVIEQSPDEDDGRYPLVLEAALFDTGRPVLLAPSAAPKDLGQHVVLAWNDTREAAEATAAAMPFLSAAADVTLITVHDGCDADPAALQSLLALHGIAAACRELEPDHRPVGEQVLDEAEGLGADLLVMGAYGHSRLRELVLGGVTRSMVRNASIPVLMAH